MIQLELFPELEKDNLELTCELKEVRELAKSTKESSDKVRKALFARHGELAKLYLDLHHRFEIIEKNLCHDKF
jgi:hypothetical protein